MELVGGRLCRRDGLGGGGFGCDYPILGVGEVGDEEGIWFGFGLDGGL